MKHFSNIFEYELWTKGKQENIAISSLGRRKVIDTGVILACGTKLKDNFAMQGHLTYCVELDVIFLSQSEAARWLGLAKTDVCAVVNGRKADANGYHFTRARYKKDLKGDN